MPVILPMDLHHAPAQHQRVTPDAKAASAHGAKTAKTATRTPARTVRTITVRAGDTIYGIARREHSTVAAIIKANPKVDTRHVVAGTSLRVPGPHDAPSAAPAKAARAAKKATPSHAAHTAHAPKPKHVAVYRGTPAAHGYPDALVAAGDRHRAQLAKADLPTSTDLQKMIVATAKRYGVSPSLALGIGMQESGFQQSAVSVCDAIGTMQVMPETGQWAGRLVGQRLDLLHAQDNITAGVTTLRFLTTHARNQDEAIGAYYQGLDAMQKHGPYSDTKHYVASVKSHMTHFAHR